MKIHVQISCVVLLALAYSCEAFLLNGHKNSFKASASIESEKKPENKQEKSQFNPQAVIGCEGYENFVQQISKMFFYLAANWLK